MLTDFFIATVNNAPSIVEDWTLSPDYSIDGTDNAVLAALWHALDPSSDASRLEGTEFIIAQVSPEGPWVFQIPDEMKTSLAELPDADVGAAANRLAKSKEVYYSSIPAQELATGIRALKRLACEAVRLNEHILLRMAL